MDYIGFKENALNELYGILDSIRPSGKILILDKELTTTVNLVVTNFSQLKDHGVEKIFWLQGGENKIDLSDRRRKSIVYLTSTGIEQAFLVSQHAEGLLGAGIVDGTHNHTPTSLNIICVPERTLVFNHILEESRVLGDVVIYNWKIHFLPIDDDVLSLNIPNGGFKEMYLDGIPSTIYQSAKAIQELQEKYGLIGRITGKGDSARLLADILLNKRDERRTKLAEETVEINRSKGIGSGGGGGNGNGNGIATVTGFFDNIKFSSAMSMGILDSKSGTDTPNSIRSNNSSSSSSNPSASIFSHKFSNIFVGTNIDHLIIIDRKTDLVTPLLTQLTYHGLIDEFFKLTESGQVDLPSAIVQGQGQGAGSAAGNAGNAGNAGTSNSSTPGATPSIGLSSSSTKKTSLYSDHDTLFNILKDINFALVGQSLNKVARQLQADYETRHDANTVSEIKSFVSKLGGLQSLHQSLRFHTSLAEDLMSKVQDEEFNKWLEIQQNIVAESLDTNTILLMIEDLINRSSSLSMILRIISLECLCKGGIKEKQLVALKHQIVQTYGHKHILTLSNLEKLGLIFARSPSIPNNFPTLRKSLNLIVDQTDESSTNDVSTAYSGYAPLSIRLVQCIIDKRAVIRPRRLLPNVTTATNYANAYASSISTGWKGAEDIISNIPGSTIEEIQRSESQLREAKLRKILTRNTPGHDKPTTLIFFLGGITYAEIADLRLVSQKETLNTNIIIATTGIISGSQIIDTLLT